MDISIREKSEKPIYEQLFEQLAAQIMRGELAPDTCLPSIRTVARELGISIITVKKAYELLEERRLIYTLAGKGCFVTAYEAPRMERKKLGSAEEKLREGVAYCRGLGFSEEELVEMVRRLYGERAEAGGTLQDGDTRKEADT